MEPAKILDFIERHYLGGLIDTAYYKARGDSVIARNFSDDRTLMCGIQSKSNFFGGDFDLPIFSVAKLVKMLKIYETPLTPVVKVTDSKEPYKVIFCNEGNTIVSEFYLASKKVISEPPTIKRQPEYQIEATFTPELSDRVIRAEAAIEKFNLFETRYVDSENFMVIIGDDSSKMNIVKLLLPVTSAKEMKERIIFNLSYISGILKANIGEELKVRISNVGLISIGFGNDELWGEYFLRGNLKE